MKVGGENSRKKDLMNKLVLLRHGESQWNSENRFTGWTDIGLTLKGTKQASFSGNILKNKEYKFDIVFTSVLKRANQTMELCLKSMNTKNIPIIYDWRLNERHYGALQGLNKLETAKKYGEEQVLLWRRSYEITPPPLSLNDDRHPRFDSKYSNIETNKLPCSECLKDTVKRVLPLWLDSISPQIKSGKKALIVAHGNSLRALIKYLDKISDDQILKLNIPTGSPLVYELNDNLVPLRHYYLFEE